LAEWGCVIFDNHSASRLALIDWCGNAVTRKARSKATRADISKAMWDGKPRRNFYFEDFNAQMKAAFDELALLNEHLANHVQIEHYLESNVDPKLPVAKATVQAHATMQDSFDEASHYMVIMHQQASVTGKPGSCVVAEAGRGGRGGRGGHGGRGGRGGRRGRRRANKPCIRLGKYENKEWHSLSKDKKTEVYALREQAAEKKRKASAVETAEEEELDKHAGNDFGKIAHKKRN
jgi:hypothetical protein